MLAESIAPMARESLAEIRRQLREPMEALARTLADTHRDSMEELGRAFADVRRSSMAQLREPMEALADAHRDSMDELGRSFADVRRSSMAQLRESIAGINIESACQTPAESNDHG